MEFPDPLSSLRLPSQMVRVRVEHLSCPCVCGVSEEERESPQTLSVDAEWDYDAAVSMASDRLEDAVDYSRVAREIQCFFERHSFHLLESFADALSHYLLCQFPLLQRITVGVCKSRGAEGTKFSATRTRCRSLAALGLGSNLGNPGEHLEWALTAIGHIPHTAILRASSIHSTAPLYGEAQGRFLNRSLLVETLLSPQELLAATQTIEQMRGRERTKKNGPRTLDIDVLLFEGVRSFLDELRIPHPDLRGRKFWLLELAELGIHLPPRENSVWNQDCEIFCDDCLHR